MKRLLATLVATFLVAHVAWAAGEAAPPAAPPVKGEVLEVLDTDAFTYMRLKTAKGETWAAVAKAPVKKGEQVTIDNPTVMQNFESKSLKRRFDLIVMGRLAGAPAAAAAGGSPHAGADPSALHGGKGAAPEVEVGKVAKAEGASGRTVAEVYANRAALKDKPVAVRARV